MVLPFAGGRKDDDKRNLEAIENVDVESSIRDVVIVATEEDQMTEKAEKDLSISFALLHYALCLTTLATLVLLATQSHPVSQQELAVVYLVIGSIAVLKRLGEDGVRYNSFALLFPLSLAAGVMLIIFLCTSSYLFFKSIQNIALFCVSSEHDPIRTSFTLFLSSFSAFCISWNTLKATTKYLAMMKKYTDQELQTLVDAGF